MISIIIPTYNNPDTLLQCLASLQKQTYTDTEVIVVDDGSRDATRVEQIVSEFAVDHFIRQENHGAPHARNRGFERSKGEYVVFLDADVVLKPTMLEKLYAALTEHAAAFAYCGFKHGHKVFTSQEFDPKALQEHNYIHTSALIRREAFPFFDESLKKFQDWDLWLTIVKNGGAGVYVPEVLYTIIDTNGTMSQWLPRFMYHVPWPVLGYTPQAIQRYERAKKIIYDKHQL